MGVATEWITGDGVSGLATGHSCQIAGRRFEIESRVDPPRLGLLSTRFGAQGHFNNPNLDFMVIQKQEICISAHRGTENPILNDEAAELHQLPVEDWDRTYRPSNTYPDSP
jgi:hypothetical protein